MSKIDTSRLNSKLKNELEKVGLLSVNKILLMCDDEFLELGNFTLDDINIIKDLAASTICPGFRQVSAVEEHLSNKWKTITSECEEIDAILGGGIPTRGITELSGESGAGKTQFCLQFSITVQYPIENGGLGSRAVYICTEDRFPSSRLHQILKYFPRKPDEHRSPYNFGDNIYVVHIATVDSLKECLNSQLPLMMKKMPVGLLVIDSIAAVFRSDYSVTQSVSRAKHIREIGLQLHKISKYFGLAVLCVNQVADVIDQDRTIPALGLAWANLVTTKLQLKISPELKNRSFHLLSAPHLPPGSVPYRIEASGIVADLK